MATVSYSALGTWTDAMATANFNSLANNGGIVSTATILDNTTNRHLYCDLSFISTATTWTVVAGGHLAVYMLPIGSDGTTYPNTNNGSTAADYPGIQYFVGAIDFRDVGSLAHVGGLEGIRIGPTKYKFYCINKGGNAMVAAMGATLKYSTYTESVA